MASFVRIILIAAFYLFVTGCVTEASYFPSSSPSPSPGASSVMAIAWAAPTTRNDGSFLSLSDIAGYRIYRGTDPNNLVLLKDTSDPTLTEFNITETQPGTYYYAVTAYDINGRESMYSEITENTVA